MFVYVEFISRRPGVSLQHFHSIAGAGQNGWAADYGEDELILNLGRTWRLGPEPEYLAVWLNRSAGLERLGGWEHVFRSGAADAFEVPMEVAARLDRAGCYQTLREPVPGKRGPYYAEFFHPVNRASKEDVAAYFDARAADHPSLQLHMLAVRIGHLAPYAGIAFWGLPDYGGLEGIADGPGDDAPIALDEAGVYANLGEEIL